MDFGIVGLDYLDTSASNNGSFSLENANKQKWHGSGFLKTINEDNDDDDLRDFKMAKISLQRSNSSEGQQQMLSFSSPNSQTVASPSYYQTSNAFSRNSGYGSSSSVKGPFTPSQWMELEHQALIYKYITANVPIPSYLLNPIRKALESAGFFTTFSGLRSNPLGWGGFHLGLSNTDPEPGRCRRTDGKKWRCSRDAVTDQKYCERHINRGRHRSRKPVEGQPNNANPKPTHPSLVPAGSNNGTPNINRAFEQTTTTLTMASPKVSISLKDDHHNPYEESSRSEFGLVYSHSLLNPLNPNSQDDQIKSQNALRQFMDEWPKNQSPTNEKLTSSPIRLSRELEMGLGVGTIDSEQNQRQQSKWVPMGGPLGEVLHNTSECSNAKGLNLMASSPTEVLQRGGFGSLSNSSGGSSPSKTLDGISGLVVAYGLVSPTIESFSKF